MACGHGHAVQIQHRVGFRQNAAAKAVGLPVQHNQMA
jgi:hypothetical protein